MRSIALLLYMFFSLSIGGAGGLGGALRLGALGIGRLIGSVGGGKCHYAVGTKQHSNTGRYDLWCEMNLAAYRKLFAIPLVLLADSWLLGSP